MVSEKNRIETHHAYLDLCEVLVFITFACSSAVSGYEGMFILGGIAQIAVVIRLVVFSLFLLCFEAVVRLFLSISSYKSSSFFPSFSQTADLPPLLLSFFFLSIYVLLTSVLLISENIFQIWTAVVGHEE